MTIIPASQLSRADMRRLGNNLVQTIRRDRRRRQDPSVRDFERFESTDSQPARGAQ